MIVLFVGVVFCPEFFELLDNLIIFADLLVDGKQQGIEREYDSQQNPDNFGFHNGPFANDERTTKERDRGVSSPPGRFVWRNYARAGTVSAQVSTAVRMASSE
jgi:hypothetical protein